MIKELILALKNYTNDGGKKSAHEFRIIALKLIQILIFYTIGDKIDLSLNEFLFYFVLSVLRNYGCNGTYAPHGTVFGNLFKSIEWKFRCISYKRWEMKLLLLL